MNLHKKVMYVVGLGLLLSTSSLMAAEKSAKSVIKHAYQYLGSLDKYAFKAVVSENFIENGEAVTHRQYVFAQLARPDKLHVDTKGDLKDRSIYINHGLFTMIDHNYGYYGQLKTPSTIDGTLDAIFNKYGIKAPMASLFYSNMHKRIKFTHSKYFGTMDVAGTQCDYVAFKNDTQEIHVWIATGNEPLVKTYSVIETSLPGNPRMNTSLTWIKNPKISENNFVFKAPENATKISVKPAQ